MSRSDDAALRRQSHPHASVATPAGSGPWPIGYTTQLSSLDRALHQPALALLADGGSPPSALGRIVFTPDGRPIRTIITGRRHIVTGSYSSRKAGRALPFESMNEQMFFMHSEVDTDVADYRAQPFRFEFAIDGVKRTYIVDCVRLLSDGRIEIVEVKNDRRALRDEAYAEKLSRVAEVCGALDWGFRVVLREELETPRIRLENIVQVQSRRHAHFSDADVYVAIDVIERNGGSAPLSLMAEALGGQLRGAAAVQAMMVQRHVAIALDRPLGPQSAVTRPRHTADATVEAGQ